MDSTILDLGGDLRGFLATLGQPNRSPHGGREARYPWAEIRPELDRLRAARFFMDQDLYDRVIARAGE